MNPQHSPSEAMLHERATGAALMQPEIMQSMELDKIAPVPPQTRKRGPLFVRAFRAYAYEGMRWAPQLSKLTGITANMIRKARSVDRWDDFIGSVHDREAMARYGISASTVTSILPADGHKVAEREQAERGETCRVLQKEIAIIRGQIASATDKSTVQYSRLVAVLRDARAELDSLLGISRIDKAKEAGAIQRARMEATPAVKPANQAKGTTLQGRLANLASASPLNGRGGGLETDCVDVSAFLVG